MNCILFDNPEQWRNLLPLTYTKPIAGLRTGILTIGEKWNRLLNTSCSFKTIDYLSAKFPENKTNDNIYINGACLPNVALVAAITKLNKGEILVNETEILAARGEIEGDINIETAKNLKQKTYSDDVTTIRYPWDLFMENGREIESDINILFHGKTSNKLSETNKVLGRENIFVEEGAKSEFSTINATEGPVYIGKDAEIMEGSVIRGPFALCEHSVLKMSAKVYGPVTIGPFSKIGGEINTSVVTGYSNKAHDGFLGNSVIGEWCNLGADTNNSNLKNNYEEVKVWNYEHERFIKTGLQFCGLIMGDHSKCGINTMFNTGTVVGVSANIFGSGFPRNFIPSFSWGGAQGFMVYRADKAFEVAKKVMARRGKEFDQTEEKILQSVFENSAKYRRF